MSAITRLSAVHADFFSSLILPLERKFPGNEAGIFCWIESQAERLAVLGRYGSYITLNSALQRELGVLRVNYLDPGKGLSFKRLAGSITLRPEGHTVTIQRTSDMADARFLLAHELGHALLYSNPTTSAAVRSGGLVVDPALERLVDHIARSILMPESLLRDLFGSTLRYGITQTLNPDTWRLILPKCDEMIVPYRIGISRVLPYLMSDNSAVLCYAINGQLNFPKSAGRVSNPPPQRTGFLRWIMSYNWSNSVKGRKPTLLADRIERSRQFRAGDELLDVNVHYLGEYKDRAAIERIVGDNNWTQIKHFRKFYQFGRANRDQWQLFFVLCHN